MSHPSSEQLQRYYDGESPKAERALIASHLGECPACTRYLAQLGGVSQLLAGVELPEFSDAVRQRTLNALRAARNDLGVRHLAEWVSAIAAVLIVGLMILPARNVKPIQRATATESSDAGYIDTVAVTPPMTQHAGSNAQLVQFAQFMAGSVSAGATR